MADEIERLTIELAALERGRRLVEVKSKSQLARIARQAVWICEECATEMGAVMSLEHMTTYHVGLCEICRKEGVVTEPRDFKWVHSNTEKK